MIRDGSHRVYKGVVANYGEGRGATKREGGGHVKFYLYGKGGGGEVCHAQGGGAQKALYWGSFYAVA